MNSDERKQRESIKEKGGWERIESGRRENREKGKRKGKRSGKKHQGEEKRECQPQTVRAKS